jgi:hypothetical protein
MPIISINEAKRLATVLQKTFPQEKHPAPNRGCWLNHLARADGYRDWNVMAAIAPAQPPNLKWGEWGDLFVAIAWVETPGRAPRFYMLTTRDRETAHPHNGWPGQLADGVSFDFPRVFHGAALDYGRPGSALLEDKNWWLPGGSSNDPVVVTSPDATSRILLWWLEGRYTGAKNLQSEKLIMHYLLHFERRAYGKEPRADQFLRHLTLQRRPRRTCLYLPEVANAGDDLYVPVVVAEEGADGVTAAGWLPGSWESIGERATAANLQAGLSRLDVQDIAERYAYFAPRQDDDSVEFYGMSED